MSNELFSWARVRIMAIFLLFTVARYTLAFLTLLCCHLLDLKILLEFGGFLGLA